MDDLFSLRGHRALVTGASGGLGRHFALTLARAGADVAVTARRADKLEAVAGEIEKLGVRAAAVEMDVTLQASVEQGVAAAEGALGSLDLLVNNAGVAVSKPALEADVEDWDFVLDTNLKGAYLVAREVARRMVAHERGGVIVNNASAIALKVMKGLASYAASKAGLVQLTQSLALELARYDIRVNALCPGYFATDINKGFFDTPAGQRLIERIPQRRLGDMSALDGPLLLLASDASKYMTGSLIVIDGGLNLN
ncbi:MAG: SDR family NAD(P)-dependent oxidoreductase [Alphaproteobacteria bacterium]